MIGSVKGADGEKNTLFEDAVPLYYPVKVCMTHRKIIWSDTETPTSA